MQLAIQLQRQFKRNTKIFVQAAEVNAEKKAKINVNIDKDFALPSTQ